MPYLNKQMMQSLYQQIAKFTIKLLDFRFHKVTHINRSYKSIQ